MLIFLTKSIPTYKHIRNRNRFCSNTSLPKLYISQNKFHLLMNTIDSTRFQLKIVLVDSMIPPNTYKRAPFNFISVFGIIISVFIRA